MVILWESGLKFLVYRTSDNTNFINTTTTRPTATATTTTTATTSIIFELELLETFNKKISMLILCLFINKYTKI